MADIPSDKTNKGVPPTKNNRLPSNKGVALPPPREDTKTLFHWAKAIHELMETGERRTSNEDDSNVKVKDLKDANFLRQNTSFAEAGFITQKDLDDAFSDPYNWGDGISKLIDYVNNYDPEARIKGSMTWRLKKAVESFSKQFKYVAERIDTTVDEFATETSATRAAISKASTEYAGATCRLNGNYYTPREFYMSIKGVTEEGITRYAENAFPSFRYDCEQEGGDFVDNAAVTRTLDEQVSEFDDLVNGVTNSSSYTKFIDTLATDSEVWTRFSEILKSDFGVSTSAELNEFKNTFAGRACYREDGSVISYADTPDECNAAGGYWLESSVAGRITEFKSQIDEEIGAQLINFQETVATDLSSVATDINKLEANYRGNSASIESVRESVADAEGAISILSDKLTAGENSLSQKLAVSKDGSYYALESDINGKLGGIRFTSDGQYSDIVVDANSFKVGTGAFSGARQVFEISGDDTIVKNLKVLGTASLPGISGVKAAGVPFQSNSQHRPDYADYFGDSDCGDSDTKNPTVAQQNILHRKIFSMNIANAVPAPSDATFTVVVYSTVNNHTKTSGNSDATVVTSLRQGTNPSVLNDIGVAHIAAASAAGAWGISLSPIGSLSGLHLNNGNQWWVNLWLSACHFRGDISGGTVTALVIRET